MKVLHDWLKDYIGNDIPTPERIEEMLTFHAFEIEGIEQAGGRAVIDVDVLPNRSSDCLSHRGIAREIATITGTPLAHDSLADDTMLPQTDRIAVTIEDPVGCRRFGAVLISGVSVGTSPDWLKERLEALGQRSINNIVDATNYVMLALGQPLHAYDAAKLGRDGEMYELGVRYARNGERITTLTGDEYELDPSIQIIVDGADAPVGLAGIKGGQKAEVDADTTDILLEAANFDPVVTRKASQKLRLTTDASKRFENEPSRELGPYALRETANLIAKIAGGTIVGAFDIYPTPTEQPTVAVSSARVNALLGLTLDTAEMNDILIRIGAVVTETPDGFSCVSPWERTDLQIEEDYVEEIGRIHGYQDVPSVVPDPVALPEYNIRHVCSERIRRVLTDLGFSEVITSSFRKKDDIQLANALATDKSYVRSSLADNLVHVLDRNAPMVDLLGVDAVRVFEIGTVFDRVSGGISEHVSLALGIRQKVSGHSPKDDAVLSEFTDVVSEALGVSIEWSVKNGVAETNLSALFPSLEVPTAYEHVTTNENVAYTSFSTFPHVSRDIALWVPDDTDAADVESVLNTAAGDLRVRTTLFDEFKKDGRTSFAFRLVFQSNEKTLTDEEVNAVMDNVYSATRKLGWEVR